MPVVTPDRVAFMVTVVNGSPHEFRGSGSRAWFVTPGQPPTPADGLGLAALAVPPGGRDRVTVYGPRLSCLSPGDRVGLELADVPTAVDANGHPTARRTTTYWYAYAADERTTSTVPAVAEFERDLGPPVLVSPGPPALTVIECDDGPASHRHRS